MTDLFVKNEKEEKICKVHFFSSDGKQLFRDENKLVITEYSKDENILRAVSAKSKFRMLLCDENSANFDREGSIRKLISFGDYLRQRKKVRLYFSLAFYVVSPEICVQTSPKDIDFLCI
jgi:hypothetical protein